MENFRKYFEDKDYCLPEFKVASAILAFSLTFLGFGLANVCRTTTPQELTKEREYQKIKQAEICENVQREEDQRNRIANKFALPELIHAEAERLGLTRGALAKEFGITTPINNRKFQIYCDNTWFGILDEPDLKIGPDIKGNNHDLNYSFATNWLATAKNRK